MKRIFLFTFLLFFGMMVSASTNCSTGCDVDGGTPIDLNFAFFNWSNPANDARVQIVNPFGGVEALIATNNVSDWGTKQNLSYFPNADGNYALQFLAQGTNNDFNLQMDFISTGSLQQFTDVNCVGTVCGPEPQIYKLLVSGTPSNQIDDNHSIPFAVKGGYVAFVSVKFLQGGLCGIANSCDASIGIRRLVDNNVVAFLSTGDWSSFSNGVTIDWNADYDGNYAVEVFYQGSHGRYDLNFVFLDTNNNQQILSDFKQNIGTSYTSGQVNQYFFGVGNSPLILFDDGQTVSPAVKGGSLLQLTIKMYDGQLCAISNSCDARILVRRLSDQNTVAYRDTGDFSAWSNGVVLDWLADYDDSYQVEIWYQGSSAQYDLNFQYLGSDNLLHLYSDNLQYIGSGLGSGNFTQYNFGVSDSPSVLLDDGKSLPYKAMGGGLFKATIRMYDGQLCSLFSVCDASFSIKDTNGSTVTSVSTGDYSSLNNTVLQFNATAGHIYFVEVWYQGTWAQFDLNLDYMDTANVVRHFEDTYQYIGAGLTTGNFTQYFFSAGAGCGNGILCANPVCKPVILNGDTNDTIDVVFSGSGFPDQNRFRSAIEFLTDFNSSGDGLFSYEPFKSNKIKFNIWMVDQYKTYQAIQNGPYWKFDNPLIGDSIQKDAILNCPHGNEFISLSVYPRFRAISANTIVTGTPTGYGGHFAQMTVGCEILGTCPYPVDANYSNPYTSYCDGNGTIFKTFENPTVGCDNGADSPASLQRLLVHEFGHSFGGLADEYKVSSDTGINSGSAPNCDHSAICSKWSSFSNIDCNSTCMYPDWKRPYENSVMFEHRVQGFEYGEVSKAELERDINSYVESPAATLFTFFTGASFQNGEFLSGGVSLVNGSSPMLTSQPSQYKVKLLTSDGNILFDSNFLVPTNEIYEPSGFVFDDNGNQVSLPDVNTIATSADVNFYLPLPYFSNAKEIRIYDGIILKLTIDLAPNQVQSSIEYGGGVISSINYKVSYTITQQPTGVLTSTNYKVKLGQVYQHE